jgi:hypothetical protein
VLNLTQTKQARHQGDQQQTTGAKGLQQPHRKKDPKAPTPPTRPATHPPSKQCKLRSTSHPVEPAISTKPLSL